MTGGTGVNESHDEIIINNATKTDTILSIDVRGKGEAAALGFVLVVGIAAKLPCFWEGALPCPSFALFFGRCPGKPSFCPPLALICPSFWASLKYTNHTLSWIATFLKYT